MDPTFATPPGASAMSSTLPPPPQRHASTSSAASGSSRGAPAAAAGSGGKHRWTDAETQALVDGCNRHGVGQWKRILDDPDLRAHFDHRSAGDLKDRFRTYFPDAYRELYPNAKTHHGHSTRSRNAQGKSIFVRGLCRPKRAFSAEETQALYDGWRQHGSHWSKIARLPPFEGKRTPTDLRDRFRNAFPHEYEQAGFKARTRERRRGTARSEAHLTSTDAAADAAAESMAFASAMESSYFDSAGWISSSSVSGASIGSDWAALSDASAPAGTVPNLGAPFSAPESRATTEALQALSLNPAVMPHFYAAPGLSETESAGAEWFSALSDAAASASSGHSGTTTSHGRSSGSSRRRRTRAPQMFGYGNGTGQGNWNGNGNGNGNGDAPPQGGFPWLSEMQMQIAMQLQAQLLDDCEDRGEEERHSGEEEDDEYDSDGDEEDLWPAAPTSTAHALRARTLTMQPSESHGRLSRQPTALERTDTTALERADTFLPSVPTVVQPPASPQRRPIPVDMRGGETTDTDAGQGASWSMGMRMDETMLDFFGRMAAEMGMTPTQFAATWADAHPAQMEGLEAEIDLAPTSTTQQELPVAPHVDRENRATESDPFRWSQSSQEPVRHPPSEGHASQLSPDPPPVYPDATLLAWLDQTLDGLPPAALGAAHMTAAGSHNSSVSSAVSSRPPSRAGVCTGTSTNAGAGAGPTTGTGSGSGTGTGAAMVMPADARPSWVSQVPMHHQWDAAWLPTSSAPNGFSPRSDPPGNSSTQGQGQGQGQGPGQGPGHNGSPAPSSAHASPLDTSYHTRHTSPFANSAFSPASGPGMHVSPPPPSAPSASPAPLMRPHDPLQDAQLAAVVAAQAHAQAHAQAQARVQGQGHGQGQGQGPAMQTLHVPEAGAWPPALAGWSGTFGPPPNAGRAESD